MRLFAEGLIVIQDEQIPLSDSIYTQTTTPFVGIICVIVMIIILAAVFYLYQCSRCKKRIHYIQNEHFFQEKVYNGFNLRRLREVRYELEQRALEKMKA